MSLLEDLRLSYQWTQREVARRINVSHMTYRRYEYGEEFPKRNALVALSKLYHMSPGELLNSMIGIKENHNMDLPNNIELIFNLASRDAAAWTKLAAIAAEKTVDLVQGHHYRQLLKYFEGIKRVEDDLGAACKLSSKLFSDKNKEESARRICLYVTETDTEKKVDYMVNCTRSFLLGLISIETMFRIFQAISNTLSEDLEYLKDHANDEKLDYNMNVYALAQGGMMIQAGIDGNKGVEDQEYVVSSLGFAVDRYALSIDNEDRQNWYDKDGHLKERPYSAPTAATDEEIQKLIDSL